MDQHDIINAERRTMPPFLLKLFYRIGAFHRLDEFAVHTLPPHISIYTWASATLLELTHHLAADVPTSVGTRLAFRLVYRDANAPSASRFVVKDLGSLVVGGGPKEEPQAEDTREADDDGDDGGAGAGAGGSRTLADAKFIVGDYISCAILPPLEDGSVAPASGVRSGRGDAAWPAPGPPPVPSSARPGRRQDDYGARETPHGPGGPGRRDARRGQGSGGGGMDSYGGHGPRRGGYRTQGLGYEETALGGGGGIPSGEWRRGEMLPDVAGGGGGGGSEGARGRGRARGKSRGRWPY